MGSQTCPNCKSTSFILSDTFGETVCESCGAVVGGSVGILVHREMGEGEGTYFEGTRRIETGALGNVGRFGSKGDQSKLSRMDRNNTSKKFIESLCRQFKATNVIERAQFIYLASDAIKPIYRIKNLATYVACAAFAIALRERKRPETLKDIAHAADVKLLKLTRVYMKLQREQSINLQEITPASFLPRLTTHLSLIASDPSQALVLRPPIGNTTLSGTLLHLQETDWPSVFDLARHLFDWYDRISLYKGRTAMPVSIATVMVALEGAAESPLPKAVDVANELSKLEGVASFTIMERYREAGKAFLDWAEYIPGYDLSSRGIAMNRTTPRRAMPKRKEVARIIRLVLDNQQLIWKRRTDLGIESGGGEEMRDGVLDRLEVGGAIDVESWEREVAVGEEREDLPTWDWLSDSESEINDDDENSEAEDGKDNKSDSEDGELREKTDRWGPLETPHSLEPLEFSPPVDHEDLEVHSPNPYSTNFPLIDPQIIKSVVEELLPPPNLDPPPLSRPLPSPAPLVRIDIPSSDNDPPASHSQTSPTFFHSPNRSRLTAHQPGSPSSPTWSDAKSDYVEKTDVPFETTGLFSPARRSPSYNLFHPSPLRASAADLMGPPPVPSKPYSTPTYSLVPTTDKPTSPLFHRSSLTSLIDASHPLPTFIPDTSPAYLGRVAGQNGGLRPRAYMRHRPSDIRRKNPFGHLKPEVIREVVDRQDDRTELGRYILQGYGGIDRPLPAHLAPKSGLGVIAALREGGADAVGDEELFAEGEMEGYLRGEEERGFVEQLWEEEGRFEGMEEIERKRSVRRRAKEDREQRRSALDLAGSSSSYVLGKRKLGGGGKRLRATKASTKLAALVESLQKEEEGEERKEDEVDLGGLGVGWLSAEGLAMDEEEEWGKYDEIEEDSDKEEGADDDDHAVFKRLRSEMAFEVDD